MTEIPEHLLKRAQAAREKAAADTGAQTVNGRAPAAVGNFQCGPEASTRVVCQRVPERDRYVTDCEKNPSTSLHWSVSGTRVRSQVAPESCDRHK